MENIVHSDQHAKTVFSKGIIRFNAVELSVVKPLLPSPLLKAPRKMHITCFTIGTRGDVQPFIALSLGLMKDGHSVRLATHVEFKDWIEKFGIEFAPVKGNPEELIQLCIDHDMFSVGFFREAYSKFLGWIDDLLISCSDACKGTELLIAAPTGFGGIHVAEALAIPFFSAFPMPWTRTRAFPHPFGVPDRNMGGIFNYMTHVVIEEALGKAMKPMINRWRKNTLGLEPIANSLDHRKAPFLYSFSPSIVPNPSDWPDWIHICGYWFLDNSEPDWIAPDTLLEFLENGPPPVYIGFGSIIVSDPGMNLLNVEEMTRTILEGVAQAGVRCILSKGWSTRGKKSEIETIVYPSNVYQLDKVPHDWLFPRCAGVLHHGGAGSTAAGLRAGVPTLIKPFFGDQYFWASRVQEVFI
jgi:sterol 3beta-glucosyltransferase